MHTPYEVNIFKALKCLKTISHIQVVMQYETVIFKDVEFGDVSRLHKT
jgi:hypothetical protein